MSTHSIACPGTNRTPFLPSVPKRSARVWGKPKITQIIEEAKAAGCENADQINGYLASKLASLRSAHARTLMHDEMCQSRCDETKKDPAVIVATAYYRIKAENDRMRAELMRLRSKVGAHDLERIDEALLPNR